MNKTDNKLLKLEKAVRKLQLALLQPETEELSIDGIIQRFEFSFELCWKAMKDVLLEQGVEVKFPKEALQKSYAAGWIDDEKLWLAMLEDRDETSHTYDEEIAKAIYERVKLYCPELTRVSGLLREKLA